MVGWWSSGGCISHSDQKSTIRHTIDRKIFPKIDGDGLDAAECQ
jgi:hypothetical protein